MKLNLPKAWFERAIALEGDCEVGAGSPHFSPVFCDYCDRDYTDSTESGGFLFRKKAICPVCADQHIWEIRQNGEWKLINAFCPAGMAFRDWVRRMRTDYKKTKEL